MGLFITASYADRHNTTFLNELTFPPADCESIQALPERFKPEDSLIFVEISQGKRIFFTLFFITSLSRERRDRTSHQETPSGWAMPGFIT